MARSARVSTQDLIAPRLLLALSLAIGASEACSQSTQLQRTQSDPLDGFPVLRLDTGDMDRDGRTDVVALIQPLNPTAFTRDKIVIQRQRAPVSGATSALFATVASLDAQAPQGLATVDLDGDADLDLAVAQDQSEHALALWLNTGGIQGGPPGQFVSAGLQFAYDLAANVIAIDADVDPTTADDLLLVRGTGRDAVLLRNQPAQSTVNLQQWQLLPHPGAVGALSADFNDDGRADVLVYGSECWLWLRRGDVASPPFDGFVIPQCASAGTVFAATAEILDAPRRVALAIGGSNASYWLRRIALSPAGVPQFQAEPLAGGNGGLVRDMQMIDADNDGDRDLVSAQLGAASLVYRRVGDSFEGVLQPLPPMGSAAVAALSAGGPLDLWLGSLADGSGIWRALSQLPAASAVSFAPFMAQQPLGYFVEGSIGTSLSITPAAPIDLQATISLLPPGGAAQSWPALLPAGSGRWQRTRIADPIRGEWSLQLAALSPPGSAFLVAPTSTTAMVVARDPPICLLACLLNGECQSWRAGTGTLEPGVFMGTAAQVEQLRQLRDERMAASAAGARYIALYESLQVDLWEATFVDPRFYLRLWALKDAWMPAIDNLVDGDGQMLVSASMQELLDEVLARYSAHGSQRLQQAIDDEIRALDLHQLQGHPIAQFQQRWEASPLFRNGFD